MKIYRKWTLILFLAVLVLISIKFYIVMAKIGNEPKRLIPNTAVNIDRNRFNSVDVFEDKTGNLSLPNIQDKYLEGHFSSKTIPYLNLGLSDSVWWIRLTPPEKNIYLSLFNPTVQHISLYAPDSSESKNFEALNDGWDDNPTNQSENFIYPIFRLTSDQPVYIKVSSIYLMNFTIQWYDQQAYNQVKNWTFVIIALFIGILIALTLSHLIQVMGTRDLIQLLYALRIFTTLFQFLVFYGVFRLLPGVWGPLISSQLSNASILTTCTGVVFAAAYLADTVVEKQSRWFRDLTLLISALIALSGLFADINRIYNSLVNVLLFSTMFAVMGLLFAAIRQKPLLSKYYMANIGVSLIFVIAYGMRQYSIIPNNELSLVLMITLLVLEALIFSAGTAKKVSWLRKQISASELSFLRAQIQPHFLFNTLNVIAAVAAENGMKARYLLLDFSEYLRHSFNFKLLEQFIPVQDEIVSINAYKRICEARYNFPIKLIYEIPEGNQLLIPALILQPLVENAIRHGIRNKYDDGQIVVRIFTKGNKYRFEVEDNGEGLSQVQITDILHKLHVTKQGNQTGLFNVSERLHRYYQAELHVESQPGRGACFWFEIPR